MGLFMMLAPHLGSLLAKVLVAKGQPGAAKLVETTEPTVRAIIDAVRKQAVEEGGVDARAQFDASLLAAMREVDGLKADAEASLLRRAND